MQPLQINLEELYLLHNAIVQQSAGTEDAENTTITNAGTIYSVNDRAIYFYDGATSATITNQKEELFIIRLQMPLYKLIRVQLYLIVEQLIIEMVHQILE